jgi:hypothetical protein
MEELKDVTELTPEERRAMAAHFAESMAKMAANKPIVVAQLQEDLAEAKRLHGEAVERLTASLRALGWKRPRAATVKVAPIPGAPPAQRGRPAKKK